jgi:cob(I)alamin adenosyltransferase
MNTFYTRRGDDGTTGILGGGRVPKDDPRPEAVGTIDEASAALGMARAACQTSQSAEMILIIQRDLYGLMGEVAATPDNAARFRVIDAARVEWLEEQIEVLSNSVEPQKEFIVPGDTPAGAALDLARTIVRRAERRLTSLWGAQEITNPELLRYLNRLSSLCFVLEIFETQASGKDSPTLAKLNT